MSLLHYQEKFKGLKPARSGGAARPHKMCMLLAVMDLIEQGQISENKIVFNDVLKAAFTKRFVAFQQNNDDNTPHNPFYYLSSSGFWHHKIKPGQEALYHSIKKSISNKKLKDSIEYAFLDKELFWLFNDPESRSVLISSLAENFDDISVFFEQWAREIGKSDKTIKNYLGALKGPISNWVFDADITHDGLLSIYSHSYFEQIANKTKQLKIFQQRNSKGNGMYNAALNIYSEFLADFTQVEVTEDIDQIMNDSSIKPTDKTRLVNTRLGQGEFRQRLIEYWHGCALTQYQNVRFLVASHIKPWRAADDHERLDVYNGILLLPNLDKAFDLGYISFSEKGLIQLSDMIESPKQLGIEETMKINLVSQHQDFMAYHREQVFRH